jgi:hypothetical protein
VGTNVGIYVGLGVGLRLVGILVGLGVGLRLVGTLDGRRIGFGVELSDGLRVGSEKVGIPFTMRPTLNIHARSKVE